MEPNDPSLSAADSLRLIQQMIQAAKQELSDNSFELLLWGWLVLAATLLHYLLLHLHYERPWLPWPVLMSAGGLIAFGYGWRRGQRERVRTAQTDFLQFLWVGFGVLLLMLLGVGATSGWHRVYPLILGLYGLGTFATGGALRFRPLLWGGGACWVLATLAFRVAFDTQLLLVAAAVVVAYIGPGYVLRNRYRHGRTL